MYQIVRAVYRSGTFVLQEPYSIPEESQVNLIVQGPLVLPPVVIDLAEKRRILQNLIARMQQNPIPVEAPYFTREELHERR